jgi:hypothetical protein
LNLAQSDKLFNNSWSDLVHKELLVIRKQLLNSALSQNVILFVRLHGLREEEIDPLRGIHLIDFIASNCTLEENISILTDPCD